MRRSGANLLTVPVNEYERVLCDDIKRSTSLDSDANLLRAALYYFATFVLGHGAVATSAFRLQVYQGVRRKGDKAVPKFEQKGTAA